jgi:DNA helicase-2/ATP-dependent DNA helicase PcrA
VTEKTVAQKDLLEDVPAVAKALESHFALTGTAFTETWVKTDFKGAYASEPLAIPIHGKLDAVIDTGSEALVFDYKTRQAMSVNALKGETKSSDGNYFRQLIFYRILVSADVRWKGKNVTPALVFVSPDEKGRCPTIALPIEDKDVERVKTEIQAVIDSVWSGEVVQGACDDKECEWCAMRKMLRA